MSTACPRHVLSSLSMDRQKICSLHEEYGLQCRWCIGSNLVISCSLYSVPPYPSALHNSLCASSHCSLDIPPSYLSKLGGGGGSLGGSAGGCGGGRGRLDAGGGCPRWGVLCATHYYHMHTSRGDACLGVWGYGGMYLIIALSRLCWEESLKGRMQDAGSSLRNKRHLYSTSSC